MALIRVAQYSSTPGPVTDYQAQNAHLQAFTNQLMTQQFILDSGTAQPIIKQGCYVSHGGSLYVADADTAITGSPADGSVYIRVSGTTSLTVEFVTDISGYTWNPVYTALTSGSYTLLPYFIYKTPTVWVRYNFNPNNQQFGIVYCTSVNTGQGSTQVHLMNQDLRTIDNVSFASLGVTGAISGASLNTGSGAMTFNQGVKTTDSPSFNVLTLNELLLGVSLASSIIIAPSETILIAKGIYMFYVDTTHISTSYYIEIKFSDGSWRSLSHPEGGDVYCVISDGTNIRLRNASDLNRTAYFIKY